MTLDNIDIIVGLSSFVILVFSFLAFIYILSKFRKARRVDILIFAIVVMIIFEPWWPPAISFLVALFNNEGISLQIYIFLGNVFIPIGLIGWTFIFTNIFFIDQQKIFIGIVVVACVLFEIMFFYLLINDPQSMGIKTRISDIYYNEFITFFLFSAIVYATATGIVFSCETFKVDDDPECKLKGKIQLLGFILFGIGTLLEILIPFGHNWSIINIILIMISGVFLVNGFLMPEKIKKLLLNSNTLKN